MTTETTLDAKDPAQQPTTVGEAGQTGGSATARETTDVQKPPSTYSTNASDAEADVESVRDASTDGNQAGQAEGVRSS